MHFPSLLSRSRMPAHSQLLFYTRKGRKLLCFFVVLTERALALWSLSLSVVLTPQV